MDLINFPYNKLAFHPHGLYLYRPTQLLFAINHAYQRGGERIEVFKISKDSEENLQATWLYSIYDKEIFDDYTGVFNDLFVLNENELYVTKYLIYKDSLDGINSNDTFHKIMQFITKKLMIQLFIKGTDVIYIKHEKGKVLHIQKANDQSLYMANGIAANKNNSKIFVVDSIGKSVVVYDRQFDNMLKKSTEIKLPVMLDNIELDLETGYFQAGSIVHMISATQVIKYQSYDRLNHTLRDCPRCGGTLILNSEYPYDFKQIIVTSQMYAISSSIRVKDYQYMGSYADNGLLKCKV